MPSRSEQSPIFHHTVVGFTGTQKGMTRYQKMKVANFIYAKKSIYRTVDFHHGKCIGADEEAFVIASLFECVTFAHPPTDQRKMFDQDSDYELVAYPFLQRNKHIVDACDVLIATPFEREERLRSGTWSTWRYAKEQDKEIELILP